MSLHFQAEAVDHVHEDHQVYACPEADCESDEDLFSEFERVKSHLKSGHKKDWPWVCGFCDQALLYELEFKLHVNEHTENPPYPCPVCCFGKKPAYFEDSVTLRSHLASEHMPVASEAEGKYKQVKYKLFCTIRI